MKSKKEKSRCLRLGLLLPLMLLVAISITAAQTTDPDYRIVSASLNCGGGRVSSDNVTLQCSMGQPTPTGTAESGGFTMYVGFQPTTLTVFPGGADVTLCVEPDTLVLGSTGNILNFSMDNSNDTVAAIQADILFDTTCFTVTGVNKTARSTNMHIFSYAHIVGGIRMAMTGFGQYIYPGAGPIAEITVDVTQTQGCLGDYTLDVTASKVADPAGTELICSEMDNDITVVQWGGEKGDVNGDGDVNIVDVLAVINHILGTVPITDDAERNRADCNDDDIIDILDVVDIVNVILGIFPECPANACKPEVTHDVMEFLKTLRPYLSAEDFDRFMTLVKAEMVEVPVEYSLAQNYPNPFNPVTTIEYTLPQIAKVKVEVYNLLGQVVEVLVDSEQDAGLQSVQWDASGATSGVYFYRLTAGEFTATKRMVLMK